MLVTTRWSHHTGKRQAFWVDPLKQVGRGTAKYLVRLLKQPATAFEFAQLLGLLLRQTWPLAATELPRQSHDGSHICRMWGLSC